jgi:hypothetical protein
MSFSEYIFIGIDTSGGSQPFTYAALDENCHLAALGSGDDEEPLGYIRSQPQAVVGINAPAAPSKGLVREALANKQRTSGQLRGSDLRLAEFELRERGILISPTPSRWEACTAWVQSGFKFHQALGEMGFKPCPSEGGKYQWLETNPHAGYCAILGQKPFPKPTLEGRLQRQLALYERGVGIKDPMEFFEEITRHRLVKGILPLEYIYGSEELDAILAAYTAYLAVKQPGAVIRVGDESEGQITLPRTALKEMYL